MDILSIILTIIGFLLMLLQDILLLKKCEKACFSGYAGAFFIAAGLLLSCGGGAIVPVAWMRYACMILTVASFALEIYVVFWAVRKNSGSVVDTGLYSYCRHPGFWTFLLATAYMIGGFGIRPTLFLLANALNFILVIIEDKAVFPKMIGGYDEYKSRVGFLTPKRVEQ